MISRTMKAKWVFFTTAKTIPGRLTRMHSKIDYLTNGLKRHALVSEYAAIDEMIFHGLCMCERMECNWKAQESKLKRCLIAITFPLLFVSVSTVASRMDFDRGMTSRNWLR